jgi:hypothetical protein
VKPTTIEVTITLTVERAGWHDSPFGRLYGDYEREHELRAEVTYTVPNDKPEVSWLDQAVVEDLGLTADELQGAEEQAAEAAYLKLRAGLTDDECGGCRGEGCVPLGGGRAQTCPACRGSGLSSAGEAELARRSA